MHDLHASVEPQEFEDALEFEDAQKSQCGGSFSSWSTLQSGHGTETARNRTRDTPSDSHCLPESAQNLEGTEPRSNVLGNATVSQTGSKALHALLERSHAVAATQVLDDEAHAAGGGAQASTGTWHNSPTGTAFHPQPPHELLQHQLPNLQQDEPDSIVVSEVNASKGVDADHWTSAGGPRVSYDASGGGPFYPSGPAGPVGEGKIAPLPLTIPESPTGSCAVRCIPTAHVVGSAS